MRRMHGGVAARHAQADLDALSIWSSMHGVVGVLHGSCIDQPGLAPDVRDQAMAHVMAMVGRSLSAPT
jgi:hypothetical protein